MDQAFLSELTRTLILMGMNIFYSILCIGVGIGAMRVAYKVFDSMTPFDTSAILEKDPVAVGKVVQGIYIGVGICAGLIIGMATN